MKQQPITEQHHVRSVRLDHARGHVQSRAKSQYRVDLSKSDYANLNYQVQRGVASFYAYDPAHDNISWHQVKHGDLAMVAIYDEKLKAIIDVVQPAALERLRRAGVEVAA